MSLDVPGRFMESNVTPTTVRNPLIRLPLTCTVMGLSRSALYAQMAASLMTRPVKTGLRTAAFPASEVEAVIAARVAGQSDDAIRALVQRLHADRRIAAGLPAA